MHLPDFSLFLHFIKLILNFNQFSTVLTTPVSPPPAPAQLGVIMSHTTAVTGRCTTLQLWQEDTPVGFFEFEYAVKSKKEEKECHKNVGLNSQANTKLD